MTEGQLFNRAEELYHAALEHPPGERDLFVARACGEDRDLLREVRSLLGFAEEAKALLEEPAAEAETQEVRSGLDRWIGRRLGGYEVLSLLGIGGMGEVYQAKDIKLGREVALKVLPEAFVRDRDRVSRFEREARLLASLNHPNVAAIHGLEEADGRLVLVLELALGETLQERLVRGAIPLDEVIRIAKQIAEGLEAAHEKGIVHRDLKPANIKLAPEGKVKILDFGLARSYAGAAAPGAASRAASRSATLAEPRTEAGIILGTAAYMSPEQASGEEVDRRTDVWSFGVVVFEMLSGRRPFAGDTLSEILAGVARDDPDWSALPDSTPPPLRSLLRRCLRKPPRERLHDIADARLELEELFASGTGETRPPEAGKDRRVGHRRSFRQKWVWAVGGVLVGGLAAGLIFARPSGRPEAPAAVHLVQDTPEAFTLGSWGDMPAPSPDGRLVAFTGYRGDTRRLWIRPLDSAEARLVPGTTGANLAFWSPDGAWIAFFTDEDLNKVRLADGTVQRICSTPPKPVGGTWAEDGTIIFSAGYPVHRLFSAAAAGGEPRPLTSVDTSRGEAGHTWPQALPGGRRFLFNIDSTQGEVRGLYVASLDAPDSRRRLLPGASRIVYASGRLLFVRDGALLAQPFDTRRVAVSGEPRLVAPAEWAPDAQWARFGVSPGGVLAYFAGAGTSRVQLAWLDRRGHKLESVGKPGPYGQIALSPDGRRVALEMPNESGTNLWTMGGTDLWVMDLSRRVTSCVTCNPESEENPVWSPDSQELAFAVGNVPESLHIFHKVLRTGAPASHLLESPGLNFPECWSRDGRTLLYISGGAFWALSPTGERPPEVVLRAESPLAEPRLSPDGRWLAYISKESGDWEVYVQPFRRPGERVRVSTGGGGQPMWRDDGKELFYRKPAGPLLVVGVREEADSLELGPPTELFRAGVEIAPTATDYGVSSDGQRFLVKVPIEGGARDSLHVVVNWPSVLEGQR